MKIILTNPEKFACLESFICSVAFKKIENKTGIVSKNNFFYFTIFSTFAKHVNKAVFYCRYRLLLSQ